MDFQVRSPQAWHFLIFIKILSYLLLAYEHGSVVHFEHQEFLGCFG